MHQKALRLLRDTHTRCSVNVGPQVCWQEHPVWCEINKAYGGITTGSHHLGLDEGKVIGSLAKYISKQGLWHGDTIRQSYQHMSSATLWMGLWI